MASDLLIEIGDGDNPEDFRFFFVSYSFGLGHGNTIIRQRKPAEPNEFDDGMNIAAATMYLMDMFQGPVVVQTWHETTKKRYDEWIQFLRVTAPRKYPFMRLPASTLGVVDGGGEKSEKKAEGLHVVKTEDPPKTT